MAEKEESIAEAKARRAAEEADAEARRSSGSSSSVDGERPETRDVESSETADATVVVDDGSVTDELPADLDLSKLESDYVFPNNSRRRIPGFLYLGLALICFLFWFFTRGEDPVIVNTGVLWAAIGMLGIGLYSLQGGWDLAIDERDALQEAGKDAGFVVGHASAQLGWRGLRSRPTWRILLYSAESPPKQRGLVLVDGVDGQIVDRLIEDNPEDWSAYDA